MTLHLSNARSDERRTSRARSPSWRRATNTPACACSWASATRAEGPIARIEEMLLQGGLAPQRQQLLHEWRALAFDALDQPESTVALWTAQHRVVMDERLPLPELTAPRTDWPERAQPTGKEAPVAFLVGAPGSLVERLAAILSGSLTTFRDDRFGPSAPPDALQHYSTPLRLASRELSPGNVASSWQMALPARGIKADVVDWLLWWDNALVALLRDQLPQARLVVALRDPRDMLLDWLAFGAATPMRIESPRLAAEWLAASLVQVADLHEQDLVPHSLVRMDDIADKPRAVAGLLGDALGISLPTPPPGLFGTDRLPAVAGASYAGPLAGEFAILQPVARRLAIRNPDHPRGQPHADQQRRLPARPPLGVDFALGAADGFGGNRNPQLSWRDAQRARGPSRCVHRHRRAHRCRAVARQRGDPWNTRAVTSSTG